LDCYLDRPKITTKKTKRIISINNLIGTQHYTLCLLFGAHLKTPLVVNKAKIIDPSMTHILIGRRLGNNEVRMEAPQANHGPD
jgi:hypothetical protein